MSNLKPKNGIDTTVRSLRNLESLFQGRKLTAEIELLQRMTPKIAVRLRNSKYSRVLVQLLRTCQRFKSEFTDVIDKMKIVVLEGKELEERCTLDIEQIAGRMFKICVLSQRSFDLAEYWHELQQLTPHFMMISCVSSRINIFFKALLVYFVDVSTSLKPESAKQLQRICDRLKIKTLEQEKKPAKNTKVVQSTKTIEDACDNSEEDFGVPLQRQSGQKMIQQIGNKNKNKKNKQNNKKRR